MIFSGVLADKVLDGSKTQTRRPTKRDPSSSPPGALLPCRYKVGATYAIQRKRGTPGLGPRIRVLSVERVFVFPISWDDAHAEGFDSPVAFESRWIAMYGHRAPGDCWRIEFELVPA